MIERPSFTQLLVLRSMQPLHGQGRLGRVKFLQRRQERGQEIGETVGEDGAVVGHYFRRNRKNLVGRVIPGVAVPHARQAVFDRRVLVRTAPGGVSR